MPQAYCGMGGSPARPEPTRRLPQAVRYGGLYSTACGSRRVLDKSHAVARPRNLIFRTRQNS